ncbi:MAG TPA: hypothetical protein VJY35_13190 [Candidatus Eisenbacteria bacterium]|nr:hypothetical protein [Candidatus Eisenbacteria bacterium]
MLVLTIALGVTACAVKPPPQLGDEQRARLGRLGVVMAGEPPRTDVAGPTPLGGVGGGLLGAVKGASIGVASAAGCFVTLGRVPELCVFALMTPYWIGRGTVEGALNAMPEGERRRALRTIEAAIANLETQRVARAVEREARDRGRPATILTRGAPDAPALDVDTVAEITLLRVELEEQSSKQHWTKASVPDVNPMFDLVAVARLRVISRSDQRVLLERTYHRRSGRTAQFADWSYNDAAEFQRARDEVLDGLAADVTLELFGAPPAPPTAGSEPWPPRSENPAGR